MKIQAFVFNWVGHDQNATTLEQQLCGLCNVTVVNSDPGVENRHPTWHHLGDEAYFAAQWNKALELFDADVLFHIQADASFPCFAEILERCCFAIGQRGCGIYAPNVDYTFWTYDRSRLRAIDADLLEVPHTDCTCWAIARDVLARAPHVDPLANKFGWGIDWMMMAAARLQGKKVVRDYRFTLNHPRGTGYDQAAATQLALAMLDGLPDDLRQMQQLVRIEAERLRTRSRWERYYVLFQQVKSLVGWR
jgi:hypothetical protein